MEVYVYEETGEYEEKTVTHPHKKYVRDSKAMACTAVDLLDLPDAYEFVADMPGVNAADAKVEVENGNVLKISGHRKKEEPPPGTRYVKVERGSGEYMRKFTLRKNANKEAITAKCKDGVLTVTVPKVPPPQAPEPKNIEVKVED